MEAARLKNHPEMASILFSLGKAYKEWVKQDADAQALEYHMQALKIRQKILTPYHPDLGESFANVGYALLESNQFEKAKEFYDKAYEIMKRVVDSKHPSIIPILGW